MVVVCFILGAMSILDVMAVMLLTFHDVLDGATGSVLAVVLCTTSQLSLLTLVVALIDVAAGVTGVPILVEVGAEVAILGTIHLRLTGVVLIDLHLNGREVAVTP
jgi:hypothetical protein